MEQGVEKAGNAKLLVRLLRFLASAGPEGATPDTETREGSDDTGSAERTVRLRRADGNTLAVREHMLAQLVNRGAVRCDGSSHSLSPEGRMLIKRLMSGDGLAFADQHRDIAWRNDRDFGPIRFNRAESPLGGLSRLKSRDGRLWFTEEMLAAGDRLRSDFTRGHLQPSLGVRLDNVASSGSSSGHHAAVELGDAALAARQRVERALASVGPELAGPLIDVCCYLKGLETVENERGWPRRSAKLMLRTGLEALARHYAPPSRSKQAHMRKWGVPGYRPDIASGDRPANGEN